MIGVAVDGKAVRGAVGADGEQTHLLAAASHGEQLVIGQVQVGVKSNEIPQFAPLITGLAAAGVNLSNVVITADALHCQRGHATYLHERGAQFCFPVKHNQPGVYTALDALPWAQAPIGHRSVEHGHARTVTRTANSHPPIAVLTAAGSAPVSTRHNVVFDGNDPVCRSPGRSHAPRW